MKVLLDTHAFLWWISDHERLSERAYDAINDGANTVLLSAASGWEIAIKTKMGKLKLKESPVTFIAEQLSLNRMSALPISMTHALAVHDLPPLHRDPFDRLLVAQALTESLPIISADPAISRYKAEVIW
jgi:PIN domain nuclease of toxin-antitoxin system